MITLVLILLLGLIFLTILWHLRDKSLVNPKILMLHRVNQNINNSGMNIHPTKLATFIRQLKNQGYQFSKLTQSLADKQFKTVVLTLDDGFADNYEQLFPLLQKEGVPATIYLATGLLSKSDMLNPDQIKEMQASGLIEFGAHTINHVNLLNQTEQAAKNEIMQSRIEVETLTGEVCHSFAYPYGRYNDLHIKLVQQAGFTNAVSTRKKNEALDSKNRFDLPRISINGNMSWWQLKLAFLLGRYKL